MACRIQQSSLSGLLLDHGMEVVQAAELIQDLGILELLVAVGAFPLDILFVAARGLDHQRMLFFVKQNSPKKSSQNPHKLMWKYPHFFCRMRAFFIR